MVKIKSDRKNKSLKGVVLIMVVTVMMMLIVLLLATMAAVSTAQNRYYSKYEENQAYYAARSALDVCIDSSFIDSNYYAYDASNNIRQYQYLDSDGNLQTEDMKQGLAMQLDTYRIKAHADTMENYEAMADKTQFSTDFWANAGAGGDAVFTDEPAKTYYEEPDLDYIEYKVQFPKITNGSNTYGGLVDQTDPSDPSTQVAKIRVEVLARTYDGHNKNLAAEMAADPMNAAALKAADILSVKEGSRHKDTIYLKITATVQCQGTEQSASVIYSTPETEVTFTGAITARGSIGGLDNGIIIDGYATPDPVNLGNMGVFVGESFAGDDVTIPNGGATIPMGKGQCTYFKSVSYVQNNFYPMSLGVSPTAPERDVPVMFIDGICNFSNQIIWAGGSGSSRDKQVDLVVNGDLTAGGDLNFNGNIIVNGDFYLGSNNISMSTDSKIIVSGDLIITSGNILGGMGSLSVCVAGNVSLGTESINRFPSTIYMQTGKTVTASEGNFTTNTTGFLNDGIGDIAIGYRTLTVDSNAFGYLDVTADITTDGARIFLPTVTFSGSTANIDDTNGNMNYVRYAPCEDSKYYTFWKRSNVAPYSYLIDPGTGKHIFLTAEEMAGTTKQSDRDVGNYTVMSFTPPADATALPSSGTLDVTGENNYALSSTSLNLTITGTGTANIFVQPGSYSGRILSDDKTKINFYFPNGSYTWNVANYTSSVFAGFTSGLRFGENDPNRIPPPKIYFYVSAGSVVSNSQTGWGMFTGYIYAPEATINTSKGLDGYSYQYYYDGVLVTTGAGSPTNSNPIVIGAIVCEHFNTNQNPAVCFIKPDPIYDAGEPFFDTTDKYYYTRR